MESYFDLIMVMDLKWLGDVLEYCLQLVLCSYGVICVCSCNHNRDWKGTHYISLASNICDSKTWRWTKVLKSVNCDSIRLPSWDLSPNFLSKRALIWHVSTPQTFWHLPPQTGGQNLSWGPSLTSRATFGHLLAVSIPTQPRPCKVNRADLSLVLFKI